MMQKISDSVIEEIHRTREEISERFRGNINAIAEDAAGRQAIGNRPIWKSKNSDKPFNSTNSCGASFAVCGR